MLRHNIKIFIIFLLITVFFILLKNGHIFDLGIIFRKSFIPNQAMNSLLKPSDQLEEDYKNLLVENSYLKTLEQENNNLRELLNFKDLLIKSLKCKNSEFDDNPEVTAYMQVQDITLKNNDKVFVFNGWTFSSSPSISLFDHPVYDIWLIKCY